MHINFPVIKMMRYNDLTEVCHMIAFPMTAFIAFRLQSRRHKSFILYEKKSHSGFADYSKSPPGSDYFVLLTTWDGNGALFADVPNFSNVPKLNLQI